jgi:hypothetical protein
VQAVLTLGGFGWSSYAAMGFLSEMVRVGNGTLDGIACGRSHALPMKAAPCNKRGRHARHELLKMYRCAAATQLV